MKIHLLTLFPDHVEAYFLKGIFKRAHEEGTFSLNVVDLREFAEDKHRKVDDYPYGYKKGMLMKADVIYRAVTSIEHYEAYRLLYTCPKGPVFTQEKAESLANEAGFIILVGYYKGVDERILERLPFERVSLGNFVLSSGELPALVITEAVLRQLPGVVGKHDCVTEDSIISGLLYPPEYTAPRDFMGQEVPAVLLSGHHAHIEQWRYEQSIRETLRKKPSLLKTRQPTVEDQRYVAELLAQGG